jgi:polysaccharide export outer membrane protein
MKSIKYSLFLAFFVLIFIPPAFSQDPSGTAAPSGGTAVPTSSELINMGATPSQAKQAIDALQNGVTPPNPDAMRKAGASEAQIKQAMDYFGKQQNKTGTQTPVQKGDGTDPGKDGKDGKDGKEEKKEEEKKEEDPEKDMKVKVKHDANERNVFGKSVFRDSEIKFYDKATDVIAPENYKLGAGDELSINVWGFSDYNERYKINEQGYIDPELIGRVYLKGLSFKDARSMIKNKLGQVFDLVNSQFEMTLNYSRVITVNIVGEVQRQGSYTIPAINTAFNALMASGGPNSIGSVRNIYIKREGKTIDTLDVYKFLLDPNYYSDMFMQNNDYIFIPAEKRIMSIKGEVKRQGLYELKSNENLNKLVEFAGGTNAAAFLTNIQIKRLRNNSEVLLDVNYDSLLKSKKDFILQDEDEVFINRVPKGVVNLATVGGAVKLPGDYEFRTGDKVSDIIKRAEGPLFDAFLDKAYIIRKKDDFSVEFIPFDLKKALQDSSSKENIAMRPFDVLSVLSKSAFADDFPVTVTGAVRIPGQMNLGSGLKVKDALALSGGLTLDAYQERAYIIREDKNLIRRYLSIDIENIMKDDNSKDNLSLERKDIIKILSKKDFQNDYSIWVLGAVKKPDRFTYGNNLSLRDGLLMAGWLLPEAANKQIEVARVVSFNDSSNILTPIRKVVTTIQINNDLSIDKTAESFILEPYDQVFVRVDPDFSLQSNVFIRGEVKYPGEYALLNKTETVKELIERAGGITAFASTEGARVVRPKYGFVFLDFKKALKNQNSPYNFILQSGDTILIPSTVDLVHISGAIGNVHEQYVNSPFFGGRAGFYIRNFAGGFADTASKKNVYVIHANGLYKKTRSLFFFRLYPKVTKNSTIFIPLNNKKVKKRRDTTPVDWNGVIEKTSLKITGIISLLLLLRAFGK